MSTYLYGALIRQHKELIAAREHPEAAEAEENKLVTALAALIPAEILGIHGLLLSWTTSTDTTGATTITKLGILKWSALGLVVLSMLGFFIGRGGKPKWTRTDVWRLLLVPCSVVAWMGIIGTSALTPWVLKWDKTLVTLIAAAIGVLVVWISNRLNPPKKNE